MSEFYKCTMELNDTDGCSSTASHASEFAPLSIGYAMMALGPSFSRPWWIELLDTIAEMAEHITPDTEEESASLDVIITEFQKIESMRKSATEQRRAAFLAGQHGESGEAK